jgi:SAM-dependent methyltransferase
MNHNYWSLKNHAYMGSEKPDPALVQFLDKELVSWFGSRNLRIADLGSGFGRYALYLEELGYDVTAVETHCGMAAYLQQLSRSAGRNLLVENRCCLEFLRGISRKPRSLDAILMIHLLHHLSQEQFAELRGIVGDFPGDVPILVVEPNRYNLLYALMIIFSPGMKWAEEKALYEDRAAKLFEARRGSSLPNRKLSYICPWPPTLSRALYRLSPTARLSPAVPSALAQILPPIWSYRYALI